jgi:polyketide synthase PksL
MVDFIEYVVAELKSRRLSKTDAVALVRQFSLRSSGPAAGSVIHPLLHRNTSDLGEQRYQSTFTGGEFFLSDHQVKAEGHEAHKILPGVAFLEMARAAIADALPDAPKSPVLELRNTAWAHPIVVAVKTDVNIALVPVDDEQIDFEIYSEDAEQEIIHCQGRAVSSRHSAPAALDLEQLERQMGEGQLEPAELYAACSRMGLMYGPAFQAITSIHRGTGQVLARLRLPKAVDATAEDFVLHPSLMDSALQASVGLVGDLSEFANEPRLPFALDSLRIVSPCVRDMVAWVRYAPGSEAAAKVVKLDIDLCDERGNVCVQLHGFSWRVLRKEASTPIALSAAPLTAETAEPVQTVAVEPEGLAAKTQEYLRKQLGAVLQVPSHRIDPQAALENYGIDSMLAMKLTTQLEQAFGSLPKTLFFEYQTVRELAEYFVANHSVQLATLLAPAAKRAREAVPPGTQPLPSAPAKRASRRRSGRSRSAVPRAAADDDPIAIIGLSGRYPESIDLDAYWANLRDGKDCIIEVPRERWDWREYYSDDRNEGGHHYSKWGGFIAGVDEFDPLFFHMSPVEAERIDPQERLFLQHAWMAIEDAGYTRASLQVPHEGDLPGQVGVYAGVMYLEYQLFGADASARGHRMGVAGSPASIANRVSYALNLHGPSMTLDTMCSSSMTAIHLACQDLKQGRTSLAIAGAVNVTIHPNKYLVLSGGQFISSDGHCQSFGEGGDGYIPGEGVGVVILKRLSEAKRDGDHIYGVIRGSALNHGGKTNGYTVPNPQAQTTAISRALAESRIDARHISYIEAHGTGTTLGDPIEIAALNKAFHRDTKDTGFCLIGSAKSNIGHCESAAGIAGLTKVLLQMQHQQIVPSLHSARLNPHIDFAASPFTVNQSLRSWEQPVIDGRTLPRIAGISSFGAGGSNAHMLVEEYLPPPREPRAFAEVAILLSAKSEERLQQKARELLAFVRTRLHALDLPAMAYTLQVGREAMEERLGLIVSSAEQLAEKLEAFLAGDQGIEDAWRGQVKRSNDDLALFSTDADLQQTIDKWLAGSKLAKLLDLWVKGLELDWTRLYGASLPSRISLPTYPFARERHWIDVGTGIAVAARGATAAVLHPLLHSNTSDLNEQRYRTTFTGDEFFLADHQVTANGQPPQKVLPGVAYLEMARAAIAQALPELPESTVLELHNTVWAQPLVVAGPTEVSIVLSPDGEGEIGYEIYSRDGERELVHCQGRALFSGQPSPAKLDLGQLAQQMTRGNMEPAAVYALCAGMGLSYGPAFQGITAIQRGSGEVLAHLRLPAAVADANSAGDYVLHPSLMDSALQAAVGLMEDGAGSSQPPLPFALESLRMLAPCSREMVAWVRYAPGSAAADHVVKLDLDLCDEQGNVCVQMHGFSSRVLHATATAAIGTLLAIPVWESGSVSISADVEFAEQHVILCELTGIDAAQFPNGLLLQGEPDKNIAQRYSEYAVACFERVQSILRGRPQGKVLVQIVAAEQREQVLFAGLSGLLKTAALENPQFIGQLVLVPADITAEALGRHLRDERSRGVEPVVRYEGNVRQILRWQEVAAEPEATPIAFKDPGVYLITGGLGGLGLLFAREILDRAPEARVVLTGRAALAGENEARFAGLSAHAARVSYRQVDLGDLVQVQRLIAGIQYDHHRLDGILHCAGMTADHFILKKTSADFTAVLAPKVTGTFNLDQASQLVELDFFVLFSSIGGALGNLGQADYATANGFMDQFAAYRNRQVVANRRRGRTRSINWPLWQSGGMGIDPAIEELLQRTTGMQPMRTESGIDAYNRSLALPYDQLLVVEGDLARMRRTLLAAPEAVPASVPQAAAPRLSVVPADTESLAARTQEYLRQEFSRVLKLPAHKIDPEAALEQYGIDSIMVMRLTNELEKTFGSLSKTLLFEYQTLTALARYFAKAHSAVMQEKLGLLREEPKAIDVPAGDSRPAPALRTRKRFGAAPASQQANQQRDIAIVGLGGRYPQAGDLLEFWDNLRNGRDSITEVPAERWDHARYFDADQNVRGKTYGKWGGFVDDVDKFDPLFFNISPREAALIDPQERLFLETAWETIEDAGYTKESIAGGRIGVYVGVMWGQYELFGAESILRGNASIPVSSHASIANRVSYFFDFHGPSIALDTMCSSSLTAIHLACDELRRGEIDAAIAGGVNLTVHPYKYLSLSQGKFIASDGRCRSFGAGGDGYVPGEGVGAVLLKPLEHALRDGDQIYAVIKSSTINHGGKTNGYSVPNPNAQGDLILNAFRKANIDPRTIGYVETHGTGTSLGDPIEITGLLQAFEGATDQKQFCPIGSVKSNIGHLESAAGIAAVTKALLQFRYEQLVPSLHADPLNPNIDFAGSPFYVQTELAEWKRTGAHPLRTGVSSFGAGGANAHLILEEYPAARQPSVGAGATPAEVFVLSAKNPDALRRYAERVVRFLERAPDVSLADIAYTSQIGRTVMDARLAIVASSIEDLKDKLAEWAAQSGEADGVFYGNIREAQYSAHDLIDGTAGKAFFEALMANGELDKIGRLWTLGAQLDWSLMKRQGSPRRVSLPTYPFARERYWIEQEAPPLRLVENTAPATKSVAPPERPEEKRRTYYVPAWTAKALAGRAETAVGPVLILDATEPLVLAMREQRPDASIVWVKPGEAFEEVGPNGYVLDPAREEHFRELVASLEQKALLPAVVVHHSPEPCNLEDAPAVAQELNRGLYSLFNLYRALAAGKHQPPRMLSLFSSHRDAMAPLAAAIGGFFRTLTLEDPRTLAKAIDLRGGGELSPSQQAALAWAEIGERDWSTQEIRYREQVRSVRGLVPHAPDASTASAPPLKQHGVYLVTGGLGGLGLIFSDYLARAFRARLVLVGRSAPSAKQDEAVSRLKAYGAKVLVLQGDVSDREDMERVVGAAKARFSQIDGVLHAAGVNRDAFILKKTREQMESVLAPKVYGAINLDLATRDERLDFFVLFSSVAGVLGNVGQSDYAYANRFLDAFAETRESLTSSRQRSGRTLTIDWPLWEEGGMTISPADIARLETHTGICPLPAPDGIRYWEDFLRSDVTQGVALYGIPSRIAARIAHQPPKAPRQAPAAAEALPPAAFQARTETYLKTLIGEEINLAPDRIGSSDPLESFGIDSVAITRINARLEQDLGELPKTMLYEHETVGALAKFLSGEAREALTMLLGSGGPVEEAEPVPAATPVEEMPIELRVVPSRKREDSEAIAIVGIHGYYPHSAGLPEYWENLKQGRDLIDVVPPQRWDYEEFYSPDPAAAADGKIYCKWGGFLDDYDKFDPHFFKISTAEAKLIDPQERLFLESAWAAIEDAGYTRESLRARFPKAGSADVGVFVGVTTNSYHLWAPEERSRGNFVTPSALPWSIANRVSYFFDFNGPSMPVDTACSSSLVAVHLACESLRSGDCQVALAGGVNLYLHPSKYHGLCQKRALSLDGKCHSYGAGDDGFVPGEGVGTLVLKPLGKAIADGDRIHAVIRGSAYDHSGRSNGYSAPNPNAQAALIGRTLEKAGIHPETIGYVEGHGTGTQLGDSLEIAALSQAFRKQTAKKQFCPIGSVKANAGHSESAAGIAGLAKIILQMQHGLLAPSIHSDEVNPNIEFDDSPFYLQHELAEWKASPDHPRRALVNSFGAGGVNACVVVEEYQEPGLAHVPEAAPWLFTLSARNEERLREYAGLLLAHLRADEMLDLASLCYTLQSGREAMEERLAIVVSNATELIERLAGWTNGGSTLGIHRGSLPQRRGRRRSAKLTKAAVGEQGLIELASRWAAGEEVEWASLYVHLPRRMSVPTYPFARERYWVSDSPVAERTALPTAQLHPLLAYNSSTLDEVSFSSSLSDTAFYAVDHQVHDEGIFPGAAFLEMACIAANIAGEQKVRRIKDVVWIQPLSFRSGPQAVRTVLKRIGEEVDYEISSLDDDNETVVHSEGRLSFGLRLLDAAEAHVSLQALKEQAVPVGDRAAFYDRFRTYGLHYGPSFQAIQELYIHETFALSRMQLPEHLKGEFGQFILHPSIIDGALQTVAGLVGGREVVTPYLPFALDELELIGPLPQTCYAYAENADVHALKNSGVMKFNIRILNESGDVLVRIRNLYVRPLVQPLPARQPLVAARPVARGRVLSMTGESID